MNQSALNIKVGDKALITVDNWFFAPNGEQYRAVFGTVRAVRTAEDSLGVRPNGKSTNWYIEVGGVTIAGCQVHYCVRTDACWDGEVRDERGEPRVEDVRAPMRPSSIYFADVAPDDGVGRAGWK